MVYITNGVIIYSSKQLILLKRIWYKKWQDFFFVGQCIKNNVPRILIFKKSIRLSKDDNQYLGQSYILLFKLGHFWKWKKELLIITLGDKHK